MKRNILGPGLLTLGPEGSPKQFAGKCTKIEMNPSHKTDDPKKFLDGSTGAGATVTTWELAFTFEQTYDHDALEVWLFDHSGQQVPFVFVPLNGVGGISWTGTVTALAVKHGGDVDAKNDTDATLPVVGDPVHVPLA